MAVSRILSADFSAGMIIYLTPPWRSARCDCSHRDATIPEDRSGPAVLPLFCLAPHGVFRASRIAPRAVSSYLAFSPLPALLSKNRRCLFCDTFRQRPLARTLPTFSTWHAAVWCSDFPPVSLAAHQRSSAIGGEFITIRNAGKQEVQTRPAEKNGCSVTLLSYSEFPPN
jgi:hypothetical protein